MSFGRSSGIIAVSPAITSDRHHSRPMLWSNISRRVMERQFERFKASLGRLQQSLEASCVSSARGSTFYDRSKQGDVHLGGGDHRLELGEALRGMRHGMVPVRLVVDSCTT